MRVNANAKSKPNSIFHILLPKRQTGWKIKVTFLSNHALISLFLKGFCCTSIQKQLQ